MRTIANYFEINADLDLAINIISEKIPCFITTLPVEEDESFLYIEIKCRAEDVCFVEEMLAPFV